MNLTISTTSKNMKMRVIAMFAMLILLTTFFTAAFSATGNTNIVVSTAASRANSTTLEGQTLKGNVYISYKGTGIKYVVFSVDPGSTSSVAIGLKHRENAAPYDLVGTNADQSAVAFNTGLLPDGAHSLSIKVVTTSGAISTQNANFSIKNATEVQTVKNISHSNFSYIGNWTDETTEHYSNTPGDIAKFDFTGNSFELFGGTSSTNGYLTVTIDGVARNQIDLWTTNVVKNSKLYSIAGLSDSLHHVIVTVDDNPYDANAKYVSLEYARITSGQSSTTTKPPSVTTTPPSVTTVPPSVTTKPPTVTTTPPTVTTVPPVTYPPVSGSGMDKNTCVGPRVETVNWNQLYCDVHSLHEGGSFPWPAPGGHTQTYGPLYTYASKPDGTGVTPPATFKGKFTSNLQSVHSWIELTSGNLTNVNAQVELKKESMSIAFHLASSNKWVTMAKPDVNSGLACQLSTWTYGSHMYRPMAQPTTSTGILFGWNISTAAGKSFMGSEPNDDGSSGRLRAHCGGWLQNPVSGTQYSDVDAMVAFGTFRVVGPDAAKADYRLELGVDTLATGGSANIPSIPGRLRLVTPEWQTFTVSTLSDAQLNNASIMNGLKNIADTDNYGNPVARTTAPKFPYVG